jgi:putative transcriptional regulator
MATKPTAKPNAKPAAKAKFKSDAFEAIHTSASALLKIGAINKTTMRSFDENCLTQPVEIKPQQIKKLRETHHVSQPIFARYLNTSQSTVQKWETGAKRPSGMALKLLAVVQKHGLAVLS